MASNASDTITNTIFGFAAAIIGITSIWQGNKVWKALSKQRRLTHLGRLGAFDSRFTRLILIKESDPERGDASSLFAPPANVFELPAPNAPSASLAPDAHYAKTSSAWHPACNILAPEDFERLRSFEA